MLTIEQFQRISTDVESADITFSHLRAELIDHLCCDIEMKMNFGLSFDTAYHHVMHQLGIDGLKKIQDETIRFINYKYNFMKTLMKVSGFLAPLLIAFGALFKVLHYPGAGIILILGSFVAAFLFLPSVIYVLYAEQKESKRIAQYVFGFIAGFGYIFGTLFKIMHWPGANWVLILGIGTAALVFMPLWITNQLSKVTDKQKRWLLYIGGGASILYLLGFLFKISHLPGASVIHTTGIVILIVAFIPLYTRYLICNTTTVSVNYIYAVIAAVCFVLTTTLISINLSTNFLISFSRIYNSVDRQTEQYAKQNDMLYNILLNDTASTDKEQATLIREQSDMVCAYIHNIALKLVSETEAENVIHVIHGNRIDAMAIQRGSELGSTMTIMLNPERKADSLYHKLENYRRNINSIITDTDFKSSVNELLFPSYKSNQQQNSWQESNFAYSGLLSTINKLSLMEQNVRIVENEAIQYLLNN